MIARSRRGVVAPHGDGLVARDGCIVALAGGVGAARLLRGLVRVVDPARLTIVVNTADDVERHGLWISPDVDSVVYTLAGLHDEERGWGLRDETWNALQGLRALGEDAWFQLGDRDLATHLWRTQRRSAGELLSAITAAQCRALGVAARVLPMSDDVVTTRVRCAGLGELHFQEYFVREGCRPTVEAIRFAGVERARPAPGVLEAIERADLLLICPSNPVISIGPILALPGVREACRAVPRGVAVSPIVAGAAVKGPAAQLLQQQGVEVSPMGVAGLYRDLCDTMVLDVRDAGRAAAVESLGMRAVVTDTLMTDLERSTALAAAVLDAVGAEAVVAG